MFRFRLLSSASILTAVLLSSAALLGQSITLTGHVFRFIGVPERAASSCGCALGDAVTTTIELRTFFSAPPGDHRPALSIYPVTVFDTDAGLGLPELAFVGNTFRLQIGKQLWVNQFVPEPGQDKRSGQLQLARPISADQPNTFTSIFSNGLWVEKLNSSSEHVTSFQEQWIDIDVDSRPGVFWNTTGEKIPTFDVIALDKTALMKGPSFMSLYDNRANITVLIQIDKASANPAGVSQLDLTTDSLKAELAKKSAEIDRQDAEESQRARRGQSQQNPVSPFFPPPDQPGASPRFVLSETKGFNPCLILVNTAKSLNQIGGAPAGIAGAGVATNFRSFIAAEETLEVAPEVIREDITAELLMASVPVVCTAQTIMSVMASKSKGGVNQLPLTPQALKIARKYGINVNSPTSKTLLSNLNMKVSQFISIYRQARLRAVMPGEFMDLTVEDAIQSQDSTARKLLTSANFAK